MKKAIVLMLVLVFMGSAAFGLEMTFGGGIMYNHSVTKADSTFPLFINDYQYYYDNVAFSMPRNGFGGFVFFGPNRYVELNLGFLYKSLGDITETVDGETQTEDVSQYISGTAALQLGAYFKYPFPVSDTVVIFPTAGMDLEFSLGGDNNLMLKWWHDIWFRGGVGADIFFTERLFLRSHVMYGIAVPVGGGLTDTVTSVFDEASIDFKYSHGLLIKVGIGFMF